MRGKTFWNRNTTVAEAEDQEGERSQGIKGMQQTDAYSLQKFMGNYTWITFPYVKCKQFKFVHSSKLSTTLEVKWALL